MRLAPLLKLSAAAAFALVAAFGTVTTHGVSLVSEAEASPFSFNVSQNVLEGEPIKLEFMVIAPVSSLRVKVKRKGGKTQEFGESNIAAGQTLTFEWTQPKGNHSYQMTVKAETEDGTIEGTQTFSVNTVSPLEITIDYGKSSFDDGKLSLKTSRNVSRVEADVFADDGSKITTLDEGVSGSTADLSWAMAEGQRTAVVDVKVYDEANTWARTTVVRIDIGEVRVTFDTNKSNIRDDQEPKLDEPLARIEKALSDFEDLSLNVYLAGYTDTVGSPADNQSLSEKRAKSIAKWFRKKGIRVPIYYAGFGESVLAVHTADNVDNELNRRTSVLISNHDPAGPRYPNAKWKRIK